ncbi:MAG: riboflavin biosynthesis protein RibF [Fibrobacteria bacterium]|nr:riboflavin biosynthesis protein RibF [Fibrobacteria bacterium]
MTFHCIIENNIPSVDLSLWKEIQRKDSCVVTIGNFDGFHLGHRKILDALMLKSRELNLEPVVLTFFPHPRVFLGKEKGFSSLTSPEEKQFLIKKKYPVEMIFVKFNREFSNLSPDVFMSQLLLDKINAKAFVLGEDHRFGQFAEGNIDSLKKIVQNPDKMVQMVCPLKRETDIISSSLIRKLLLSGELERANTLLGYRFFYTGTVVKGDKRGRTLGFPTANLETNFRDKILLAHGVYGAMAKISGKEYPAIVNVGKNPTFKTQKTKIEAHILDFKENIYGQNIALELNSFIRKEHKFESKDLLINQIKIDINTFKKSLENQ